MEIEVDPERGLAPSDSDDNSSFSSCNETIGLNYYFVVPSSQWETNASKREFLRISTSKDASTRSFLSSGLSLRVLLLFLGLVALLVYGLSMLVQRLLHQRRTPRKKSSRSQQPFRLNRANSSFADLYRDLRSDSSVGRDTGILGRIRSATSYYFSTNNKPQRPSSMDISDNIQRLYLDSDADRVDREADESLFARVLEQDAVIASLHQAPETSHARTSSSFDHGLNGPHTSSVQFRTWIPPPSWDEASLKLVSNRPTFQQLARKLSWEFGAVPVLMETLDTKRQLTERQRRAVESSVHVEQVRIEVHRPVEMGVLYIHRDGFIAEHTFRSAQAAAQFQTDVTMLQACGNAVYCLFQALVIAQNGSLSSAVAEPIFNCEKGGEDQVDEIGIAWADVLQCLGNEMPCIRFRLDALLYMEGARQQESALLQSDYQRKRLLLGPIDFFRLFVPTLPETAVPIADSNRMRSEHVMRVRKRVARAAVLVHSFVTARCVVNRGWNTTATVQRKRRMAFDDTVDNDQHDLKSQKEYYETNQKQGYALVGIHSLPWNGPVDPVLSFRSLRALVEDHPHLHFLIQSFYMESQELLTVKVFVRSLAPGIDSSFDAAVKALIDGDKAYRDGHLQMGIQLGAFRDGLPLFGRLLLFILSIILRFEIGKFPKSGASGTILPTLNLSAITARTLHFGGSFCTNESLPNNYVAFTGKKFALFYNESKAWHQFCSYTGTAKPKSVVTNDAVVSRTGHFFKACVKYYT